MKPPIVPEVQENPLKFWENAQLEFIEDEEEIEDMKEAGGFADVPNEDAMKNLFRWAE